MRRLCCIMLVLLVSCSLSATPLRALEKPTHETINKFIAGNTLNGFSLDSYLINQLGFLEGIDEEFRSEDRTEKVWKWISLGGRFEDEPLLTYSFTSRPANHFHNPLTDQGFSGVGGSGFPSGESAITWAQKPIGTQDPGGYYSWLDTRDYFYTALTSTSKTDRDQYFAKTFRGLGQLMHLVTDMSVPEHARDDGHYLGALPFLGSFLGHYETYVLGHHEVISQYPAIYFDISAIGNPNPLGPVPVANLFFDTDQYKGLDPAVTLATTSGIADTGLSEYANANFLSPDTMFTSDFPFPRVVDCVLDTDEVNNRRYLKIDPNANGEKVNHLAVVSWLYFWRTRHFPQYDSYLPLALDSFCYQDYASYLIPRAVGYSAGLLNYFFRGEINMVPDDEAGSGYVIVNKTEEDMDGTFELYYDDSSDQRIQCWTGDFTLGTMSSGNNESSNIDFTAPDDAKELGKYILVFRGGLGNETDAVVGKVVEPPSYWEPFDGPSLCEEEEERWWLWSKRYPDWNSFRRFFDCSEPLAVDEYYGEWHWVAPDTPLVWVAWHHTAVISDGQFILDVEQTAGGNVGECPEVNLQTYAIWDVPVKRYMRIKISATVGDAGNAGGYPLNKGWPVNYCSYIYALVWSDGILMPDDSWVEPGEANLLAFAWSGGQEASDAQGWCDWVGDGELIIDLNEHGCNFPDNYADGKQYWGGIYFYMGFQRNTSPKNITIDYIGFE